MQIVWILPYVVAWVVGWRRVQDLSELVSAPRQCWNNIQYGNEGLTLIDARIKAPLVYIYLELSDPVT